MNAAQLQLDRADEAFALGTYANVVVMVWRGDATVERLRAAAALVERHAAAIGAAVGVVSVIEEGAPPPDAAGTEQVASDQRRLASCMWSLATVLEGAEVEYVLDAGFAIDEARRGPLKQRHCADVREAAAWLASQCPEDARDAWTRGGLVEAAARVRAAITAPA